ncbi:MAG: precorrin-2 C(20)-methyltransferase [Dissulfuribacterales bacterium]
MTLSANTLYGIGVGPGDPELLTLKAARILKEVNVIYAAASSENDYSIAHNIIRPHIGTKEVHKLPFPMTKDRNVMRKAWHENADQILKTLKNNDTAFVTLGDPLTYSTFGYLMQTMNSLKADVPFRVEIVPGITSYNAAACRSGLPLVTGEECLFITSGAFGGAKLREIAHIADTIVMLKAYRYFNHIYDSLEELNLLDNAMLISRCGMEEEQIITNLRSMRGQKLPYLSLLLIKKPR